MASYAQIYLGTLFQNQNPIEMARKNSPTTNDSSVL